MTKEEHSKKHFGSFAPAGLVVVAVIAMLSSCSIPGFNSIVKPATISDCITGFSNAYSSGNEAVLYQYFSANDSMYNQIKPSTYWDNTPFWSGYSPQPLTSVSSTSSSPITASFTNNTSINYTVSMTMAQVNGYWYISTFVVNKNPAGTQPVLSIS